MPLVIRTATTPSNRSATRFRPNKQSKVRRCPTKPDPLILDGQTYHVENDGAASSITIEKTIQRNWSRVAKATYQHGSAAGDCFVKQYLDASGAAYPEHQEYEYQGAVLASQLLGDLVTVPKPIFRDDDLIINVFEHVDVVTVDELLRSDEDAFWKRFPLMLEKMSEILTQMQASASAELCHQLPVKTRRYSTRGLAVNFKGFEIRNTGYQTPLSDSQTANTLEHRPVMFDFVRPYIAPIEEAAAKMMVSIGMLNWGKPLSRFLKGSDSDMLTFAKEYLDPFLDRAALRDEIEIQRGFRFQTIKSGSRLESQVKKSGLNLIGSRYMKQLEKWLDNNIA